MALLKELADAGHTVILISHDPKVAQAARRVVRIRNAARLDPVIAVGGE